MSGLSYLQEVEIGGIELPTPIQNGTSGNEPQTLAMIPMLIGIGDKKFLWMGLSLSCLLT